MLVLLFVVQFWLEGLHKTRWMVLAACAVLLLTAITVPLANRLPLSVQRCLTVFPLDLDPSAIEDARGSTQWRLEMWRLIVPDIPKYFWVGKGFAIDPKDMYFATEGQRFGGSGVESSIVAGDYHSGPLTVIMPFGIWGVLAFTWFIVSSFRVLWINYKNSEQEMQTTNTFLLCFFVSKTLFFLVFFGSFYVEFVSFASLVGLSVSINRGVGTVRHEQVSVQPARREPEVTGTWQPA